MDELMSPGVAAEIEDRFLKIREVIAICGKSRSSLYAAIKKGEFPAPVKVGGRASAWVQSEIRQWKKNCIRQSREGVLTDSLAQIPSEE